MSDKVRQKFQKMQEQIEDEKDYCDAVQAKKKLKNVFGKRSDERIGYASLVN